MSLVLTNWKAAFLRERGSGFLAVYAVFVSVFGFVAWIRGSSDASIIQDALGGLLLIGPVYAVLRMQRGMVTKPMLFCLPRYRESLRALTFSAALLAGLGWATLGPFPPDRTAAENRIDLAGGFLAGMVLYLALTTPRLILSRRAFIWFRRAAIGLVILVFEVLPTPHDAPFVVWPVLMPVFVSFCAFVWIRLGGMGQSGANVVFAASGALAWIQRWPVMFPLVLPGGRKERCRATLGAVVAVSLLLLVAASAVVVLSWLLTPFLGGAPAERPEAPYVGLQAHSVFWTCLLVPSFAALGLLGVKLPSLAELCTIVWVIMLVLLFSALTVPIWPAWTLPVVVAGVFGSGWLFLLLVLWAASKKWDLVSQGFIREN